MYSLSYFDSFVCTNISLTVIKETQGRMNPKVSCLCNIKLWNSCICHVLIGIYSLYIFYFPSCAPLVLTLQHVFMRSMKS